MEQFFGFLGAVLEAAARSRQLDPGLLAWVEAQQHPVWIVFSVAMLAAASTLLGNSVVLFVNRVRGLRFWFAIVLNGASLVLLYLLQALATWIAGSLVVGGRSLLHVTLAVMLSMGPLVYGVLEMIPFVGPWIARVLQVWSLLALWVLISVGYDVDPWAGLLVAALGWGATQVLAWAFAKPVTWLGDRFWQLLTGRPSMLTGHDILAGHPFMPVGPDATLAQRKGGSR